MTAGMMIDVLGNPWTRVKLGDMSAPLHTGHDECWEKAGAWMETDAMSVESLMSANEAAATGHGM